MRELTSSSILADLESVLNTYVNLSNSLGNFLFDSAGWYTSRVVCVADWCRMSVSVALIVPPKVIASSRKTIDAQLLIGLGGSIKRAVIREQEVTHCNFVRLDHYL